MAKKQAATERQEISRSRRFVLQRGAKDATEYLSNYGDWSPSEIGLSEWESREDCDKHRAQYAPNARVIEVEHIFREPQ